MDGKSKGLQWRAHYINGQTISYIERTWENLPSGQIVAIVWRYNDGPVHVEVGTPYYIKLGTVIFRVWDPTLYLRKFGTVKFGRWTETDVFNDAWTAAVRSVVANDATLSDNGAMKGGIVAGTRVAVKDAPQSGWAVWYDNLTMVKGSTPEEWAEIPSDGVLAAMHAFTFNGITLGVAMRRYTFYYWNDRELANTDDLNVVIDAHPQFKRGIPEFKGGDYLGQAHAIKAALDDKLEDL